MYQVFESVSRVPSDEAWLIAACVGVLIACWIRPIPKDSHWKCGVIYLLIVLGMYFFAFKVPRFLSDLMDPYLAAIVCVVVYTSCCWFFITRKLR